MGGYNENFFRYGWEDKATTEMIKSLLGRNDESMLRIPAEAAHLSHRAKDVRNMNINEKLFNKFVSMNQVDLSNKIKEICKDPEYREKMSSLRKKEWDDLDHREMMSNIHKERCKDPEYRKMMSNNSKEMWDNPEHRQNILSIFQSEEFRKNASEKTKEQWEDEEFRKKYFERINTDEYKQKRSIISKELWQNEEYKKNHTGEKNASYKGAIIGTNIETGEEIVLKGTKEIIEAGFSFRHISSCVLGKRKSHKGYTWRRETLEKDCK
jgi:hypothetical protein